ncbi:MAG TPA: ATP-binding protein [Pyrinomonadaceae bacterium]|nr:ATP-binding protein [Pyrinomonadaceae bacterium]
MLKTFSWKSLLVSLGLALLAGAAACAIWRAGLIDSLQAAFVVNVARGEEPLLAPQTWLGLLLIATISTSAGFFVGRVGARRSFLFLGFGFLATCTASLLVSRYLKIDILFAPMALGSTAAVFLVQLHRLWLIDTLLTRRVDETISRTDAHDVSIAENRLTSGLKLLQTILPLEEAFVFQPNEDGALVPCARLRSQASGSLQGGRNSVWRKLVQLCDKAATKHEIALAPIGEIDTLENVAMPLQHGGRTVGTLLLRLRESFDQSDRRLLAAVGGQLARDLQREDAQRKKLDSNLPAFISARTSGHRLHAFDLISGVLTEHRFGAQVLAEASDGYAIAYLDGTIAYVNPAMLWAAHMNNHDASKTDLFGLLDRFKSGVFDEPAIAVRRVLQSGEPYERELKFPDRNQTLELRIGLAKERNGNGNGNGLNGNGAGSKPLCFAIRVRDVTRMKEFEKLKSDMISLMSHELRTPLTSINGFAELLVIDANIPEESREFLQIISNESQRMARMIDTFLTLTQLERADKQEVTKIALRLDEVVNDTVNVMQPTAKKKRIRLVEQSNGSIPPVSADKSLITQALTKLLDNAIRYSPERTTVTVSTVLEAEAVRVVVEDRGYGVPQDSMDRIWEKFYRVARDGQEKDEESTGLGLSFVKEVIEQHEGTVAVESEVGRGSKFSFALPRL